MSLKMINLFMMGEGIGPHGSAFKQTLGLWEEFGNDRVKDTPVSELGLTGAAVGWAKYNIRVNAIAPCQFKTPGTKGLLNQARLIQLPF